MSDILKTASNSIPSFIWSDGEQPDATKYRNIFGAFSSTINLISGLLGPVLNSNVTVSTKDSVISSNTYLSKMSYAEQISFLSAANSTILNTFNLARILGPHAALNPAYLPGSVHLEISQGIGYRLATGTKIQQLPFPPTEDYAFVIADGARTWEKAGDGNSVVASPEGVASALADYFFYIDESGTLYTNATFDAGVYIRYDLVIPNTAGYLGAGYNCIPDLSVLSIDEQDRSLATGGKLGCLEISFVSNSSSYSIWQVKLPEVISLKEPLLSTASKLIDVDSFNPVGMYSEDEDKRFYVLNTDLYAGVSESGPTIIDNNLLALFNQATGETYILDWEVATNITEDVPRSYYVSGPASLTTIFRNDADALLSSGGINTKDFILFVLGTNVAQQLAQISTNFAKHRHTGADSYRISHKDLLDAEGNVQGIGDQEGVDGGLDFRNYNRQLAYSEVKDNPHAQYLNRLGFLHGGSHGLYEAIGSFDKLIDLNAMHGDLLFYPIESLNSGTKPYKYASSEAYATAKSAGDDVEQIYWELDPSGGVNISAATAGYFPNYRTHAMIFGWPNLLSPESYNLGATKLYYEPWNFLVDTEYDNTGKQWSLARHGFVPGDYTGLTGNAKGRGLSINWGNLFFGYREDIFGGLLTGNEKKEASAYWRAGEFNVVTTGNNIAGSNTNSAIKTNYSYRDGFAVKAMKGSNVWLSTGGDTTAVKNIPFDHQNSDDKPGVIALEASTLGTFRDSFVVGGIKNYAWTRDVWSSGAGLFAAPSLTGDGKIPWALDTGAYTPPDKSPYAYAGLWNTFAVTSNVDLVDGGLLDIYALAPDHQKMANDGSSNYTTALENIIAGTDSNLSKWVQGRPFVRGTYGINFCSNNDFVNLEAQFKTGYHKVEDGAIWGPLSPVLKTADSEYIHREFRFWGKNVDVNPSAASSSLENTVGGNINMLYNFGRNYTRFGQNLTWSNTLGSLSGGTDKSPWANSRRISLGAKLPEEYGSAIRQASYVEAFSGFRNDPLQPYTVDYVYPFYATYNTGISSATLTSNGMNIETVIKNSTFILADTIDGFGVETGYFNGSELDNYKLFSCVGLFDDMTIDSLLRGSEDLLIKRSYTLSGGFPRALAGYKVKLNYFMGKLMTGSSGGGNANTPHTNGKYYSRIGSNTVEMVDSYKVIMGASDTGNKAPIVASDSHYDAINLDSNINSTIPYSSSIALMPNVDAMTSYRAKFSDFETRYGLLMSNKQFCLFLNIHDRTNESYLLNSSVPYRIFIGPGDTVYISVSGTITFKMISAYHKTPVY